MKRLTKAGLMLLVLVLAYLFMLPATWIDALLQRETRGSFGMTGTSGSLWRGEGSLQALLPDGEAVTLAPVSWNVAAGELLALRLHVTLRSSQSGNPILDFSLAPGEARIHEAKLGVPASLLGVLSPTLRAAALSGQLIVQANDMRIGDGQAAGNAHVLWSSAGSELSRVRPLGSYQLDLNGQAGGLDFRLTTLGGDLNLSGSGRLQPGKAAVYQITAVPVEAKRQDLAPLLRMLGREVSPGTYQLSIDPNVKAVSN
jgi:general secretion pathway protein N